MAKFNAAEKPADRLLKARVKALRAALDRAPGSGEKLRRQEETAIADGIEAILQEFNYELQVKFGFESYV